MELFILSTIIGYFIVLFVNYIHQQNDINNNFTQKLELTWNSDKYHIHHWITFSIIIVFMLISRYSKPYIFNILLGLFTGGILEGFLFDDWHIIKI